MLFRSLIAVFLGFGLVWGGCGSSTPAPESAATSADDQGEEPAAAPEEQAGGSAGAEHPSDPETTEEVIETSEPLE